MSILIKGMEMPDKCGHCRFANAFDCTVTGNLISTHSVRQPDCPLVPVPPHGRLIDADAFFDDLLFPSKQFELGMRELVADAPTIIEAEEGE